MTESENHAESPARDDAAIWQALRDDSNDIFRRMVQGVRDYAMFLLTPQGVVATWNVGAERIKGWKPGEIIGRHFSTFYTEDAIARGWPAEELRRAARDGHLEDEGWRLRKDGTRFWANVIISALHDAHGELIGYSKVTRDLTERREHERRLADSERNLRLLVEQVQDYAIFQLDPTGVITSWNLGAERINGWRADEAIGRHFTMFYPPEAVASGWPAEELRRAAAAGRFEDEGWRLRKDGSRIWANVVITAIRDDDGTLLGFSKVTRDLTERRRHEEQLREREENLRLLVEGVKDHAMFMLDPGGRIRTWNPGARRLLGHDGADAIGRDVEILYPADEVAAGRAKADLVAARAGGLLQAQGWRMRSDGTRFWAETTLVLLHDAGTARGFAQIIRDLTERRRVEKLEDEGRRISEFIAMLSHELRNPLAPIRNAMAILQRHTRVPEAAWAVQLVGRQVDHMSRLVDDLLDVSRVTTGKIRLDPAPLELRTLVRMAVDGARGLLQQHGHGLVVQLPEHAVPVLGDTTRLTQVILNLLGNAAKYTPDSGQITVALEADARLATLRITDTGAGMSEALLQTAFEPFVQGERTLERADGGLGIGLTLVRRIVEMHGGTVALASPGTGKGTTVTLTLPVAAEGSSTSAPQAAATAPAEIARHRRVLVVDDNADAAESLGALLRMNGHEVTVAYDGPQALAHACALRPQVVLLDVGLPGLSGLEVARRLRAMPALGPLRLIAITGYGQPSDIGATKDAGFDLHLTKPVDLEELVRLIE